MINSVKVTNFHNKTLKLKLNDPWSSGFIIKNIFGLGPGKATINVNDVASTDGGIYNSSRLTSRNIVFTLQFVHDGSKNGVEEYRNKSYQYFPLKKELTLTFYTDSGTKMISGYVESNEPNIFSQNEETQISIICPDPYFYDETLSNYTLSGYESSFEFPFSNESLTENLIEFSRIIKSNQIVFDYSGDADTGVNFIMMAKKPLTTVTITNIDTKETMTVNSAMFPSVLGTEIRKNDIIEISTHIRNRYANIIRGRHRYSIINSLGRYTDWIHLQSGTNTFMYNINEDDSDAIDISFYYRTKYEGI